MEPYYGPPWLEQKMQGSQDVFLKNLEVKFSMLIRALPLKYEVENLDKLVTLINKLVNHFLMANGMS